MLPRRLTALYDMFVLLFLDSVDLRPEHWTERRRQFERLMSRNMLDALERARARRHCQQAAIRRLPIGAVGRLDEVESSRIAGGSSYDETCGM